MKADFSVRYGVDIQTICADLGLKTESETVARQTKDLDVGLLIAAAGFGTSRSAADGSSFKP
jgi:uncharacterized protein